MIEVSQLLKHRQRENRIRGSSSNTRRPGIFQKQSSYGKKSPSSCRVDVISFKSRDGLGRSRALSDRVSAIPPPPSIDSSDFVHDLLQMFPVAPPQLHHQPKQFDQQKIRWHQIRLKCSPCNHSNPQRLIFWQVAFEIVGFNKFALTLEKIASFN